MRDLVATIAIVWGTLQSYWTYNDVSPYLHPAKTWIISLLTGIAVYFAVVSFYSLVAEPFFKKLKTKKEF